MGHPAREFECAILIENVAMCAPACRMVLVSAWAEDDGTVGHEMLPVVALRTCHRRNYSRVRSPGAGDARVGSTHAEMVDLGWKLTGSGFHTDAIHIDAEYGLVGHDDDLIETINCATELVACTWPPERDQEMLAPAVAAAGAAALARAQAHAEDLAARRNPG